MEEYRSNSHKMRNERENVSNQQDTKKVNAVITGSAKTRKKSDIKKLADIFLLEDIENVKSYILMEVLVPAIKKAISDVITNGADMILYGKTGQGIKDSDKVSYWDRYDGDNNKKRRRSLVYRNVFDYDEVVFDSYGKAAKVLDAMFDIVEQYGVVSVGDMYDLANVDSDNFMANKYGWSELNGSKPVRIKNGYILKLPKALPLD